MLFSLLVKMLSVLVLCRVLLIAGVQTLTIDSQLGTSIEDCFERISIGEQLPNNAIYRNTSELTNRECELICKQDKQCQAYDYGVGAKGNATCNLSTLDEKTIKEQNPLKRHPDYDVYIRRFQCEQSPPTPIQPLSDDPGSGPQHRPVFRPEIDERPSAEDYLISADLYGKPDSAYRPDDASNNKPDHDVGPSYGDHKPQNIPFKPDRPNSPYRPERPNAPYKPERPPNDPYRPPSYGPNRPNDQPYGQEPYKPNDPQRPSRPEPNDVLQFQGISKPRPTDEYRPDPYRPEKPNYHYIIRPNRKPRPQDYPNSKPDSYYDGHPSGPVGPPDRPYRPSRPYEKPSYSYHGQYASNYGQSSQYDNSLYVEIHDPPRPYIPIKDRPNQQYNGQGYLGYGTYSSQNSYSQSQNSQYSSSITEIGGYGQNNRPFDRPERPGYKPPVNDERPSKPGYGTSDNGYGSNPQRPNDYEKPGNQGTYGNQGSYGTNQGTHDQVFYNTNKGSYNKGSYGSQSDYNQGSYGSNRPVNDHSNYGETGYGQNQTPNDYKPSYGNQGSYGQNSNKGSYSSYNEQNSNQGSYGSHASYDTYRPHHQDFGQPGYQKPQKPSSSYDRPYDGHQSGYGSNQGSYGSNQGSYGSNQGGYDSNQSGYGTQSSHDTNQAGYGSSSSHGSQGNYGSQNGYGTTSSSQGSYGSNQGSYGSNQGYGLSSSSHGYGSSQSHESQFADHSTYGGYGNRPSQDQRPGYGNSRPDYSNRPDYDYDRPGYGEQNTGYGSQNTDAGYGQKPSHDSQTTGYGQKPSYDSQTTGYGQKPSYDSQTTGYGQNPSQDSQSTGYGQKPSYDSETTGYGQKPSYDSQATGYGQKPGYDSQSTGYGQKPDYDSQTTGYGQKPGYDSQTSSYGQNPSLDSQTTGYGQKPSHSDQSPGYNDQKPGYNDKPDPGYRPDVKPVYEYEMDKPGNVPNYIAKPGGEVVTSRPVVIGDYERPVYKEPGIPGKREPYKACFRRVLAGQRALRSFVRRVVDCERLEDCRQECALEKRFHCESFNYRLDTSFRGKGLCELMTKPIEAFDLHRDFVQDKDYDFYEVDRNSLEPNCPETLRGPGLLHSGFLSSKDRPNRLNDQRPSKLDGWRDRNDWIGNRGNKFPYEEGFKGNRRYDDRNFVPYQIGVGRTNDDQESWGLYGGVYGGAQYYKNRNDYHKSIHYWGLTTEQPYYGVKHYYSNKPFDNSKDKHFDYHSLGKKLHYFENDFDLNDFDHNSSGNRNFDHGKEGSFEHHGSDNHFKDGKDDFDYYSLGKGYYSLGKNDQSEEDFYGIGNILYRYGYGAWKRGKWNTSGVINGIDEEDLSKTFYERANESEESTTKGDCFSRRKPGMSLSTGAIRRSLIALNVVACEAACFGEKEFKCVSYSYRYSTNRGTDNCYLSERPFHGLDLSADSGSDVYGMPADHGCVALSHTPWIESECFFHVRSDTAVSGPAVKSTLTVAGLGACEAECIRAQGFFCRGFSFRFDSPTIGEELHNCILTSSPTISLSGEGARRARGHELYARGNYGRGCEPHAQDDKDNEECYLQYDKAARLTPSATRGLARVPSQTDCSAVCTDAPFKCLSFSYKNNAPPDTDNCLLSEIRLFDLQKDVDYEHSADDWLFAFDLFNSKCWKKMHGDEHSPEIPHPITQTSSEEDSYPSVPSYGPVSSGPDIYIPGSGPPSGSGYHPRPLEPHYPPSSGEKVYPSEPTGPYKPIESSYPGSPSSKPSYPGESGFKPAYPGESDLKPDYGPPESYKPSYRPDSESYRPGFRPDSETYRPVFRPDGPLRPPDNEGYKPFRPDPRPDLRPDHRPDLRPDHRPDHRPQSKPDYRPELPGAYKPGFRPEPTGPGFKPGHPPDRRPGHGSERPSYQGDREGGSMEVSWRHYTVSGFPCRTGTTCAQNHIVGHWACEPEGGEIGSWDYCCSPSHRCGYSEGFHKPWCYVGPKEDQWRPCSEKYYPYHQHNVPHPSSQGHREEPRPPSRQPSRRPDYIPHWDQRPGPYLSPADKQYWDDLYRDGPKAYYDKYGNPLPGYSRVPTENRPRIRTRYNPTRPGSEPGTWVPVSQEDPTGVPASLGAPRYWPVAYLHKDPPPNTTYFRYNETRPQSTTEKYETTTLPPLSRELPESRPQARPQTRPQINDKPDDLEAKSSRDDKKINVSNTDNIIKNDSDSTTTTTEVVPVEKELNISEVESMKTENYKELDRIDGIDDKLDDFSKSIEVLDIEDAKSDKLSDLKTLEAEERQIEAIGRLLASRRGTKLILEKRSQKDLETKNIAIDKDLVDFNFGNRFPTERRAERRGVIKRISKDDIERERNIDRSLEVSETTFVRPPRVLSTTEDIRKAIVNGKVFYDATIRDQKDLFSNATRKPKTLKFDDSTPFVTNNNNYREQRDIYSNSTRKPRLRRIEDLTIAGNTRNVNNSRKAKSLRPIEDVLSISNTKNLREERDAIQNYTQKSKPKRHNDPLREQRDLFNSSRKTNLRRLEENAPSLVGNSSFGRRKVVIPRNVNPVRRVRRVYRKRYNPEEVRKRLLERDRNRTSTESSRKA